MLNYQGTIQKAAAAKEECYHLATDAYNAGRPDIQQKMYEIADGIQVQLDKLMDLE